MNTILEKLDKMDEKLDEIKKKLETLSTVNIKGDAFHKEEKEYFEQDFTKVIVLGETDKSWYIMKDGKQMYLAKQFIKDPINYDLGAAYDITLKEKSDNGKPLGWVKEKWETYKAVKNRG